MVKNPHKEGQLSLELVLLALALIVGGLIVGVELLKNQNFESTKVTTVKNLSTVGFANTASDTTSLSLNSMGIVGNMGANIKIHNVKIIKKLIKKLKFKAIETFGNSKYITLYNVC